MKKMRIENVITAIDLRLLSLKAFSLTIFLFLIFTFVGVSQTLPSAATNGGVVIGNGSDYQLAVIPDCDSQTSDKIMFNLSTLTFTCKDDQKGLGTTLTGNLITSNLGIQFTASDDNPTCSGGKYTIYADDSESKLKMCQDGTVTDLGSGGASSTFTALTDTPSSFSGQSLKVVRVNSGETALEFATAGTGTVQQIGTCAAANCAIAGGTDIFPFIYEGTVNDFQTTFSVTEPTADRSIVFPDLGGTVSLFGSSVDDTDMTNEDFGDFSCDGSEDGCTLNAAVAGAYLTYSSGAIAVDDEAVEYMLQAALESPATDDDGLVIWKWPNAYTIQRVSCATDTGTVTIQLDERAEATPNTSGTDVMSSTLVCDSNNQATTSFANATIDANDPLNLDIDAVASSPTNVKIWVEIKVND